MEWNDDHTLNKSFYLRESFLFDKIFKLLKANRNSAYFQFGRDFTYETVIWMVRSNFDL